MFGLSSPPPPPPEPEQPAPDYTRLVDRELRIADNIVWAEQMWAEILGSLRAEADRMRGNR